MRGLFEFHERFASLMTKTFVISQDNTTIFCHLNWYHKGLSWLLMNTMHSIHSSQPTQFWRPYGKVSHPEIEDEVGIDIQEFPNISLRNSFWFQTLEITFAHYLSLNCPIVRSFVWNTTAQLPCPVQHFKMIGQLKFMLWTIEFSRDLSFRLVSKYIATTSILYIGL